MENFRDLAFQEIKLKEGISRFDSKNQQQIIEALELSKQAHQGQKRDEGDPFVIHPIRIANILHNDLHTDDPELVTAALLHDVVEDTNVTAEEINTRFGDRVRQLVISLTRDESKETKRERFEKDLVGPAETRLMKTCDWVDNLRSLSHFPEQNHKWERVKREAEEMYMTLAEATGNDWLTAEMRKAYRKLE